MKLLLLAVLTGFAQEVMYIPKNDVKALLVAIDVANKKNAEKGERFMTLLYRVKLGEVGQGARDEMRAIAEALIDQGAEVMVAACTEVPLVIGQEDLPVPLIDSSAVLARRAVALALAAD